MENLNIKLLVQNHEGTRSYELQEIYTELPDVRETDSISFSIICANNRGEPKIFLQDHPIILNRQSRNGEVTEYSIEYNRYLMNYFGVTSVAVIFSGTDELIRVTPINVYATKINKEQAEKILEYLSLKMEDVTKICFSKTQVGSNSKTADNTDTLTKIAFSRRILEGLYSSRHRFSAQPCKRSIEALKVTRYDDSSYITDKDISWLFQHLDQLYPTPIDASKVSIHNRHYSIDQIQRTIVEIETDLFENQVIYGFLLSVKSFLIAIPEYQKKYQNLISSDGYYTFDSILKSVEAPLMERRFKEARTLLQQCNELICFFKKNIPCSAKGPLRPILTPQAKRFGHYERSFRLIDAWYNLGQPKWTGTNYLFGMKSLDRLYEFFCLFKITDNLLDIGFRLTKTETREPDRASGIKGKILNNAEEKLTNYFHFEAPGKTIELYYEPTIWAYSTLSKKGELIDIFHSKNAARPYYTPDFLICITNETGKKEYLIFDAKYSSENQTKEKHLPNIIDKYYLKLRSIDGNGFIDASSIKLVYALIPKTYTQELGFHGGPFNIYDTMASAPFFGFLKLSPDEDRPLIKILRQSLNHTPQLIRPEPPNPKQH
jgi:hypothetical protein